MSAKKKLCKPQLTVLSIKNQHLFLMLKEQGAKVL